MNAPHRLLRFARILEHTLLAVLVLGSLAFIAGLGITAYTAAFGTPFDLEHKTLIEVDPFEQSVGTESGSPASIEMAYVEARLDISPESTGFRVLEGILSLIGLALGLFATFQMWRFAQSVRTDHPFIPANARRLRAVAWVTIAGFGYSFVTKFIRAAAASDLFPFLNFNISLRLNPTPLMVMLLVLVIAEIFNIGVKMKAEADLTV